MAARAPVARNDSGPPGGTKETTMSAASPSTVRKLLGALALGSVVAAAPAAAELAAWDQARVTAIAGQWADAADAWQQALRDQPGGQIGSGDAEQAFGLGQKAEALHVQTRALAGHLAKGEGYDKTRNYYRDVKELVDDSDELAQRAELDEPTMDAWAKVVDLQRQIAPYYDPKADAETAP